jgi:hypothetical protein
MIGQNTDTCDLTREQVKAGNSAAFVRVRMNPIRQLALLGTSSFYLISLSFNHETLGSMAKEQIIEITVKLASQPCMISRSTHRVRIEKHFDNSVVPDFEHQGLKSKQISHR